MQFGTDKRPTVQARIKRLAHAWRYTCGRPLTDRNSAAQFCGELLGHLEREGDGALKLVAPLPGTMTVTYVGSVAGGGATTTSGQPTAARWAMTHPSGYRPDGERPNVYHVLAGALSPSGAYLGRRTAGHQPLSSSLAATPYRRGRRAIVGHTPQLPAIFVCRRCGRDNDCQLPDGLRT
jgi:hypothetical protein